MLDFCNGKFFISYNDDNKDYVISSSENCVKWTQVSMKGLLNADPIESISYGNGMYLADAATAVLTSKDGKKWTLNAKGHTGRAAFNDLIYGNNIYLAVGASGFQKPDHAETAISNDGVRWTVHNVGNNGMNSGNFIVAFGNGKFVRAATDGGNYGLVVGTSTDGIKWEFSKLSKDNKDGFVESITYGNGMFVAVGSYTTSGKHDKVFVKTSKDGIVWKDRYLSKEIYGSWGYIANYVNNLFVITEDSRSVFWTSKDGVKWYVHKTDFNWSNSRICYANGKYITIESKGNIVTSTDGIHWSVNIKQISNGDKLSVEPLGTETKLLEMVYGNGFFVAIGYYQSTLQLFTSVDGTNWSLCTSGSLSTPRIFLKYCSKLTFVNNNFYLLGGDGEIVLLK